MLGSELALPGYSFSESLVPGEFTLGTLKNFFSFVSPPHQKKKKKDQMVDMFLVKALAF